MTVEICLSVQPFLKTSGWLLIEVAPILLMNLREIVTTVGIPIVVLSHQSGVSRFKLYQFMNAYGDLREDEQQAVLGALLAHGQKVEQALTQLRRVASA